MRAGEAFDDLGRAFRLQQGKVSVAVMPSFAMNQFPQALVVFRQRFPDINITIDALRHAYNRSVDRIAIFSGGTC